MANDLKQSSSAACLLRQELVQAGLQRRLLWAVPRLPGATHRILAGSDHNAESVAVYTERTVEGDVVRLEHFRRRLDGVCVVLEGFRFSCDRRCLQLHIRRFLKNLRKAQTYNESKIGRHFGAAAHHDDVSNSDLVWLDLLLLPVSNHRAFRRKESGKSSNHLNTPFINISVFSLLPKQVQGMIIARSAIKSVWVPSKDYPLKKEAAAATGNP